MSGHKMLNRLRTSIPIEIDHVDERMSEDQKRILGNINKSVKRNLFLPLDSRYRDRSIKMSDGIRFELAHNASTTNNGVIGLDYPLDMVSEIEIMNSILFPIKNQSGIAYHNVNYFNEITMLISELQNQSYKGATNNYHFTFVVNTYDTIRCLLPIPYNSIFRFPQPRNIDRTLTLRFFSPTYDYGMDDDNYQAVVTYRNPAMLTTTVENNLTSSDVICFENFSSSSTLYDSTNPASIVFSEKFYTVTPIDSYSFTIPLDFTVLATDPLRPSGPTATLTSHTGTLYNAGMNLQVYISSAQLAQIGDSVYITAINTTKPLIQSNVDKLLRTMGYKIVNITTYNALPVYSINFNCVDNPLTIGTVSLGEMSFTIKLNPSGVMIQKPTVSIYVGSRRVRVPLRIEC